MSEKDEMEVSEAQIAVHWQEEDYYYPSEEFVARITSYNVCYTKLLRFGYFHFIFFAHESNSFRK